MAKPKSFFYNETISIKGSNLMKDITYLKIDENDFLLSNDKNQSERFVSGNEIKFKLNSEKLKSGVQVIQVVHPLLLGNPKVEHKGFTSKSISIKLHPIILSQSFTNDKINLHILPSIKKGQKCLLILTEINELDATVPGKDYIVDFSKIIEDDPSINSYSIAKPANIDSGKKYLVRVKIDNMMSRIEDDYKSPFLVI